jgi:hypothetical protein
MGPGSAADLAGEWELAVDLPGAEAARGQAVFETMGEVLVQRTRAPVPEAPDSYCLMVPQEGGSYLQHYFDSRGTVRLDAMTFDGRTWTLERATPDFGPLDFCQRFTGTVSDDGATIAGEWQTSGDGRPWTRDFGLTCTRAAAAG